MTNQVLKQEILTACKAIHIPEGTSRLWSIDKVVIDQDTMLSDRKTMVQLAAGTYTYLRRYTTGTMHRNPPGEIVMEDTYQELTKHMNFMMKAHGRVLVTGLGLGCVVRGLLANPAVESVVCIEKSRDVLRLVRDHMPKDRLKIIHADALEWVKSSRERFNCAYHDLWTDREAGEPHLAFWHSQLLRDCLGQVAAIQGAWAFPHVLKQIFRRKGVALA